VGLRSVAMNGGVISTRAALVLVAAVLLVIGVLAGRAALDNRDDRNDRVCQFSTALSDSDDDC